MSVELTDELILHVEKLARTYARAFRANRFFEDLVSAGVEAAVRSARDFREQDGPSRFESYLAVRIRGGVLDEARRLITRRFKILRFEQPLSLDAMTATTESSDGYQFTDSRDEFADRVTDALLLIGLVASMDDRERFIVREHLVLGRLQSAVARDLGVSVSRVSQIEAGLRRSARELMAA